MEAEGRTVVITGGSGGICSAMAMALIERGDKVASLDIVHPNETPTTERFLFVRCDVAESSSVEEAVDAVVEKWGFPHVLVNGAAVSSYEEFHSSHPGMEMKVNYLGSMNLIHALLPVMLSRGEGYIHNIGSMLSLSGQKGMSGYLASKAALAAFTRSLSIEIKGTGVFATMFYPPLTRTDLTKGSGMPERMMADPIKVGRALASKVGSSRHEEFPDLTARLQASLLRWFPGLAANLIGSMIEPNDVQRPPDPRC